MANFKNQNVLLVEDTTAMHLVVQSLIGQMCTLKCVTNLQMAEDEVKSNSYSLVLLDVMLPDGSGFNFCKQLRTTDEYREVPIMFLTSKDEVDDKVMGLELGADDYITKPLEPKEFVARVASKLRVQSRGAPAAVRKGVFKIDSNAQKIYMKNEAGVDVDLNMTPIEYKLLSYFVKNEGRIFAREELKVSIWGPAVFVSDHTLDTHIYSTRKKIAPFGQNLKAIVKQGYSFTVPMKPLDAKKPA